MTRVTVRIPAPLRACTLGADEVHVHGNTVAECVRELGEFHHGLRASLLDARGGFRLFLGDQDVRALHGLETRLEDEAVLTIVPEVAGGACARSDRRTFRDY